MATIFYIKAGMIRRAQTHLPFCAFSSVIFSAAFLFFGCSILPLNSERTAMPTTWSLFEGGTQLAHSCGSPG